MNGLTFNLKHSYTDFGLIMNSKKISSPSKKKIKVDVPFMNSSYDFSTVGSNGEIVYNQRSIDVNFTLLANSKNELHSNLSIVLEWLQDTPQCQLIFDDISYYYFLAEVEDSIEINEEHNLAEIVIKFIAEPFKTSINYANNDIWDTFNFEEDMMQDDEFDVVATKTISIYNPGRLITPTINCSANMSIILGGKTFILVVGDNKIYDLKLQNGANSIVINGTGHIKFIYRKVVL